MAKYTKIKPKKLCKGLKICLFSHVYVFFLLLIFVIPINAYSQQKCIDVLKWKGSINNVEVLKETLLGGILASQAPYRCQNIVISIQFKDGKWEATLYRKNEILHHAHKNIQVVATMIESWLVPPVALTIAPPAKPVKNKKSKKYSTLLPILPISPVVLTGGTFSTSALGAGVTAEGDFFPLRKQIWGGISVSYFYNPVQASIKSSETLIQLKAGTGFSLKRVDLMPGIALGYSSSDYTDYSKKYDDEKIILVNRGDFVLSLFLRTEIYLTSKTKLLVEFLVKYKLSNFSYNKDEQDIGGNSNNTNNQMEELKSKSYETTTTSLTGKNISALLMIGIGWDWWKK